MLYTIFCGHQYFHKYNTVYGISSGPCCTVCLGLHSRALCIRGCVALCYMYTSAPNPGKPGMSIHEPFRST